MKRVLVIGGGASGLMAAYVSGKGGNRVTVIDKNEKLGKKIYITGKGRCNLTNDCPPEQFLQHVVHGERFMNGAIRRFSPQDLMRMMEELGLPLKTERGNRVFPVSDHASDVTAALMRGLNAVGAEIKLNEEVLGVECSGSEKRVVTSKKVYTCDCVIVATGGLSYPLTGSTGDGYRFAKNFGHTIIPAVPSLVGINLEKPMADAQGISLKNVILIARRAGKVIFSEQGEFLFTHYGISGPLVLTLSALINRLPLSELNLTIDLKPALSSEQLNTRILRDLSERKNEQMKNVLRGLLPKGLVQYVLNSAVISGKKQANSLTKEERLRLVGILKEFTLGKIASLRGFSEAVVTSGGIDLKEINPKTMESKLQEGIFFCGEVLDIDAFTGGFNLQLAFSSGYMAGLATI